MAVSISISVTQNSQSIANNKTNVTVKVTAKWTNGSYNAVVNSSGTPQANGWLNIDGTKYTFASTFNTGKTTSGSQTIFTKTVDVSHKTDGTKTLSCSASYTTGVSSGTVTASATKALTTIARKSTLSVANGTLGTAQTLTITEQTSSFTHKLSVSYSNGSSNVSSYILGSSSSTSTSLSVSWTPPASMASSSPNGTTASATFTLTTYTSDGTSIGSNNYTKKFTIPSTSTFSPTCSIAVSDSTGYLDTYGSYIKGRSKLKIAVTDAGVYGSTITSRSTTANNKTYTAASITTGVLANSGKQTIKTTVTDSRNRTASASKTVSVIDYAVPKISSYTATRSKSSGTASSSGEYLKVVFSSSVTALNDLNSATYTLKYRKTGDTEYTEVELSDYTGNYSVSDGSYIFEADTASSYEIILTVTDDFDSVSRTVTGSSVKKLWSILAKGVGVALGKVAELSDVFDVDFLTIFRKDVCVGNKEAYLDGKDGIYLDAEGFIHLQRTSAQGYHPYISFFIDNATSAGGTIRLNSTTNFVEFLNASGYTFDNAVMVGEKTGHQDGKTGVYINKTGYMHLQRASTDGNPYIGFYLDNATASGATIQLNANNGYLQCRNAVRYTFDNILWVANSMYAEQNLRIGADGDYSTNKVISTYWADSSSHNIVERSSDGLTSAFGWAGSSSYATITRIRGRTCQYQNSSGTTALSDERMKKDFTDLEKWETFFDTIEPCAFRMKTGTSGRFHIGFKAQQIEQALTDAGLTTQDFAGFVKMKYLVDEDDPEGTAVYDEAGIKPGDDEYGLIYTEFVALNTHKIQKLQNEMNELKAEVSELKQLVQELLELKGE